MIYLAAFKGYLKNDIRTLRPKQNRSCVFSAGDMRFSYIHETQVTLSHGILTLRRGQGSQDFKSAEAVAETQASGLLSPSY